MILIRPGKRFKTSNDQNQQLKESVSDLQAKSMMHNLILGGLKEEDNEIGQDLQEVVTSFFKDKIKMESDKVAEIEYTELVPRDTVNIEMYWQSLKLGKTRNAQNH